MVAIPQHMISLSRANHIRIARAVLKREIAAGDRTAASVLLQCPDEAETMTVLDLLDAQYRWGPLRARKALIVARIPESKTVGDLTPRQRDVLVELLEWGVS